MRCAWQEFIRLLPFWIRKEVDDIGSESLQELRIRTAMPPTLILKDRTVNMLRSAVPEDLQFVVNAASQYSPWSAATCAQGYLTAPGGHRIGVCGEAVMDKQGMTGIRTIYSLCMRVARDFQHISDGIPVDGRCILIIGKPGSGKTTLLRDLIRRYSNMGLGSISVVDERCELFPSSGGKLCFPPGNSTDILSGCPKRIGIINTLRTMGPGCIAVDEITQEEDCQALYHAAWSGVSLFATAHAVCRNDLLTRPVYRPLLERKLFDTLVILQPDKTWKTERL